jgi:hypothetical protein
MKGELETVGGLVNDQHIGDADGGLHGSGGDEWLPLRRFEGVVRDPAPSMESLLDNMTN